MLLIAALYVFAIEPTSWYDADERITCPKVDQSHVWKGQRVTRKEGKWTVTIEATGKQSPPYDCVRIVGYQNEVYWIARDGDRETLLVDATPGLFYDALSVELAHMPVAIGGRVAYVVLDKGKFRVVHGTTSGPAYDQIGALPLPWRQEPDGRLTYEARCGSTLLTVVAGAEAPCNESASQAASPDPGAR